MIWRFLYNAMAVPLMTIVLLLSGLVSKKVRRGIKGRLGEGDRLRLARSRCRVNTPRIVVHCASAGELESAVPLMDEILKNWDVDIILTYYSPSAVERANKISGPVDHFYLPIDSKRRIKRFLDTIEPSIILFVKHDYWPNLVWLAKDKRIPTVLVNGNFRPDSKRLKRIAIPFGRAVLPYLTAIFTIARDDAHRFQFLAGTGVDVLVVGDTRFDRVKQRALSGRQDQGMLADKLSGKAVVIAGSTWPNDEKIVFEAFSKTRMEVDNAVLVLAPHEPSVERINQIHQQAEALGFFAASLTEVESGVPITDIIIIDRVGVLAGMYGLGKIAYVGGGFGAGVHSVIEPAVFGIPVLFGPRYLVSHEARDLLKLGAAISVEEADPVKEMFVNALRDRDTSAEMGIKAGEFVENHTGVANKVSGELGRLAGF